MEAVYHLANGLGRLALATLGIRFRITGAEHIPRNGPVVLASTHDSFPDFVILERVAVTRGRYVRFLTRADTWDVSLVGRAMDGMQHVPVDRRAPAHAFLRARSLLRRGEALGVFPEAGISHAFTVRGLMRGTAALAAQTGAPVLPVAIWGMQRVFSVGDPKPPPDLTRGRLVDVHVGAPWQVPPDADLTAATVELGRRLTDLLEGLQHRPEHTPRPGEYASWYPAHLGGHAPSVSRAAEIESLPRSAVRPQWGPPTLRP